MRPTATDGVGWSVGHDRASCKTAEPIEMPFRMWTRVGWRNLVSDGVQIPTREGAILRAKKGPAKDMHGGRYTRWHTQSNSAGNSTGTVGILIEDILYGVHTGDTWRIRLNRPCAAAMRP